MAKFIYAECSVIKFRKNAVVLYPLIEYQEEVKPLHSKRVASSYINLYES
jgi:hypothetical protein